MTLPIHRILWAGNDPNHIDHLHVEGIPYLYGTTTGVGLQPPASNPGWTPSIQTIWNAISDEYGTGYYFLDPPPPEPNWSNMGIYNRRPIAGSIVWSQHAWANALDIGPLIGVAAQQEIYNYLTTWEGDEMTPAQMNTILTAIGGVPRATWMFGHKVDEDGNEEYPSAYQFQIRTNAGVNRLLAALPDITTFDTEELQQIAVAVNDEIARRQQA